MLRAPIPIPVQPVGYTGATGPTGPTGATGSDGPTGSSACDLLQGEVIILPQIAAANQPLQTSGSIAGSLVRYASEPIPRFTLISEDAPELVVLEDFGSVQPQCVTAWSCAQIYVGTNQGLYYTVNNGLTWTVVHPELSITHIACGEDQPVVIAVAAGISSLLISVDGLSFNLSGIVSNYLGCAVSGDSQTILAFDSTSWYRSDAPFATWTSYEYFSTIGYALDSLTVDHNTSVIYAITDQQPTVYYILFTLMPLAQANIVPIYAPIITKGSRNSVANVFVRQVYGQTGPGGTVFIKNYGLGNSTSLVAQGSGWKVGGNGDLNTITAADIGSRFLVSLDGGVNWITLITGNVIDGCSCVANDAFFILVDNLLYILSPAVDEKGISIQVSIPRTHTNLSPIASYLKLVRGVEVIRTLDMSSRDVGYFIFNGLTNNGEIYTIQSVVPGRTIAGGTLTFKEICPVVEPGPVI